jgi:hypothetical protein
MISTILKPEMESLGASRYGEDVYKCRITDKYGRVIKITIKREYTSADLTYPRVHDYCTCPACGMKHRQPYRRTSDYCPECRGVKHNLMVKGITQSKMANDMDKYNQLIGIKSLLRRFKKQVKEHEKQNRRPEKSPV